MRRVSLRVGGKPIGTASTWAYPKGNDLGTFRIPTYQMTVTGTNSSGRRVTKDFEVFRFGVSCKDGKTASVVGLADQQMHTIRAWLPNYRVHSANSQENGGWQVYGNFLIHDGPDDANEIFASIGCIEVMGPRAFVAFNDLLIELSGAVGSNRNARLNQIASARMLTITYDRAVRPPLVAI